MVKLRYLETQYFCRDTLGSRRVFGGYINSYKLVLHLWRNSFTLYFFGCKRYEEVKD